MKINDFEMAIEMLNQGLDYVNVSFEEGQLQIHMEWAVNNPSALNEAMSYMYEVNFDELACILEDYTDDIETYDCEECPDDPDTYFWELDAYIPEMLDYSEIYDAIKSCVLDTEENLNVC